MFALLQDHPIGQQNLPNLQLTPLEVENATAKFDLTLSITDNKENLRQAWEFNRDLFESATIRRMIAHFQTLLAAIVASLDHSISKLPIITTAEQQILVEWNDTELDYPSQKCINQLFK